jgi:hypothetical protein
MFGSWMLNRNRMNTCNVRATSIACSAGASGQRSRGINGIMISGSVDPYGRVTARKINLSSGGGMRYDESLSPPGDTTANEGVAVVQ